MLRFIKKFDVLKDVFSKIEPSKLKHEGTCLTLETSRLAIVGHERTGRILVTFDGFGSITKKETPKGAIKKRIEKVTFIDMYDPKTRTLEAIYKHDTLVTCVGATISESHSLLAFTMLFQTPPGSKETRLFSSLIVEIREGGKYYQMSIKKREVQRVQFLYTRKPMFYLLFFFDRQFVQLYQIPVNHRNSGVEIAAHPNLVRTIVSHFEWMEWDKYRNRLYVLQKLKKKENSFTSSSSTTDLLGSGGVARSKSPRSGESTSSRCVLRCLKVLDSKSDELWEIPLKIQTITEIDAVRKKKLWYGIDRRAEVPECRFFTLLRLNGNSHVLCQQHATNNPLSTTIKVTMYLLHDKTRLDFDIPMNNMEFDVIAKTRVFFGPIGGMILVYIPSVYIRFVDCGAHHPTYPGLVFSGSESVPSLSGKGTAPSFDSIIPYHSTADPSKIMGHLLLDSSHGICYEYLINRSAVLDIFVSLPPYLHVPALHMAIVHMQDKELVDEIFNVICTQCPFHIAPLLPEFLIGSSYELSKKLSGITPQLSHIIPITSQRPVTGRKSHRTDMLCSELKGYYILPAMTKLIIRDTEQPEMIPRYQHDKPDLISPEHRYVELVSATAPSTRVGSFLKDLFSRNSKTAAAAVQNHTLNVREDKDSSLTSGCNQLLNGFITYMIAIFPKTPRDKIVLMAQEYRSIIANQTNFLYKKIVKTLKITEMQFSKSQAMTVYQVLESFYCALEELCFPCPLGFSSVFVTLGNECLPRSVFLQYIERNVFSLNVAFVENLISKLGDMEADQLFKYELLSHLSDRKRSLEIMHDHSEYSSYLLQYYMSQLILVGASKEEINGAINLQETGAASFIPRLVFINSIRQLPDKTPGIQLPLDKLAKSLELKYQFQVSALSIASPVDQ